MVPALFIYLVWHHAQKAGFEVIDGLGICLWFLDVVSVCRWCVFDLLFLHLPVCFSSCELHLIPCSSFFSLTCPRSCSPYPLFINSMSLPVCWPHPFIPINILCSFRLCFHRDASLSFWVQKTESPKDLLCCYFPWLFSSLALSFLYPSSSLKTISPCPSSLVLSFSICSFLCQWTDFFLSRSTARLGDIVSWPRQAKPFSVPDI